MHAGLLLLALLAAPAAADEVRLLVVDLQPKGEVQAAEAEVISEVVTARLQRYPRASVLSRADLREMSKLEAERQTLGCEDTTCLAEIADALGAELIVTGTLGRLGARYVVTLNLIDVQKARAVARETIELDDLTNATGPVRAGVDRLMEPMRERTGRPEDEVTFVEATQAALNVTGWTLAGVGAGTLIAEHVVFLITYFGLSSRPIDTAYIPVLGPFCVFLNTGLPNAEPANNESISNVGFACCACELLSCALCVAAPAVLGGGAVVGLFADEGADEVARDLFAPPPPAAPLDDDQRARLASMAY